MLRVSHAARAIKDSSVDLVITPAGMKPYKQIADYHFLFCLFAQSLGIPANFCPWKLQQHLLPI